jgi:hypothetical protein
MKSLNEKYQKLINVLRAAYYDKERAEVSRRWQMDVMRSVRHLGPLNEKTTAFFFIDRFVWRFATIACTIALILSIYAGISGFNPTDEIANGFFGAPVEFTLAQVLGE